MSAHAPLETGGQRLGKFQGKVSLTTMETQKIREFEDRLVVSTQKTQQIEKF